MKKFYQKIINKFKENHLIATILHIVLILKYKISNNLFKDFHLELAKPSRFRGLLGLRKYLNGEERCIGCKLCVAICPNTAIKINTVNNTTETPEVTTFEIDLFKCVNCGWCEQACPVDAIAHTNIENYHITQIGQQVLTKEKLLSIGERYEHMIIASKKYDVID